MIRLFSHWIRVRPILLISLDFVFSVACVVLMAYIVGRERMESIKVVIPYAVFLALAMIAVNAWRGLYQVVPGRTIARTRAPALYMLAPFAYVEFTLSSVAVIDQGVFLLSGVAALFGTLVLPMYRIHSRSDGMARRRVLILGVGTDAQFVGDALKKSDPDIQIVGFFPTSSEVEVCIPTQHILPRVQTLSDNAHVLNVHEIIVAVRERRGGVLPLRELLDCRLSGVKVLDLSSYYEREFGQIHLESLHAGWLIFGEGFRQGWRRTSVKRLFDIGAALILLVLALPVMVVTALLIIMDDGFPLIYRQERVGLNGRLLNVIKFRSMRKDAESDGKPRWATENDDRTTIVGRIIRKLRIDELPQLFSVLSGEMSLVGPRPERPYFVDQLTREIPFYAVRHSVKPGVTGWAQVNYHYGASVDDSIQKLQYDLYYVKNNTLFLDIVILFETVGVVLTAKGAQ